MNTPIGVFFYDFFLKVEIFFQKKSRKNFTIAQRSCILDLTLLLDDITGSVEL